MLHLLKVPQPPQAALQLGAKCSACVSLWGTLTFKLPHKCYVCFLRFCSSRILMTFSLPLLGILVVLYGSCSDGLHRLTSLCSSVTISQLYGLYNPNAQETELCQAPDSINIFLSGNLQCWNEVTQDEQAKSGRREKVLQP